MHLYLALLIHRDYFAPAGCISIFLFCSTGIISTSQMHLYLALLLHRDYFRRSNASLSCSFVTQGLFPQSRCISILHFCYTGITLPQPDASLSSFFVPQGLFRSARCISIFLFCSTGIISTGQMHPQLALLLHRDYFHQPNASLSCSFAPQGLFPPARCISISLFCSTGIISAGAICTCSSQESAKTKYFISFHFIFLPIW